MKSKLPTTIEDLARVVAKDGKLRRTLCRLSHRMFFAVYFQDHITCAIAPMHEEIFRLTEDEDLSFVGIVAFRGSAKTTLCSLSLPIWAILGRLNCKHILILSQTMLQARQHMSNIRAELEANDLLRKDLGPFEDVSEQWSAQSIVIPKFKAKITVASPETSIRGLKHGAHRPDLIVLDDVEDLNAVRNYESREKLFNWFASEVVPAGDTYTRFVCVGNFLSQDSLLMRLKEQVEQGQRPGKFVTYPLIDENGQTNWPGKYPDEASITDLKKRVGSEAAFEREYLLLPVARDDQVIRPEWIHYYDQLPEVGGDWRFRCTVLGVDLAIAEGDRADYTAIVIADVYYCQNKPFFFVRSNPLNEHLNFPEQRVILRRIIADEQKKNKTTYVFIEDVAYQKALVQELQQSSSYVYGTGFRNMSKVERLTLCSPLIKDGEVLFPEHGDEQLIGQVVGLGQERHDDLVDALTTLVLGLSNQLQESPCQFSTMVNVGLYKDVI